MAYSIIQAASTAGGGSGGDSTTGTFPSATTAGNSIVVVAHIDRYDANPNTDAAPTASRGGADSFSRVGWVNVNGNQIHILVASSITQTVTTGVTVTETVGANCDIVVVQAFEVSGLATSSIYLGGAGAYLSYPGTGAHGGGTFSPTSQPAMLLGYARDFTAATLTADTSAGFTLIASQSQSIIEHRRITATSAVEATFTAANDDQWLAASFALAEGGGSTFTPRAMLLGVG